MNLKKDNQTKQNNDVKWYYSLRVTLLVSYVFISFLPLMFYSNTVYNTLEKHYIDEREGELSRQANVVAVNISAGNFLFDDSKTNTFDFNIEQTSKEIGARILVIDKNGVVVNDSNRTEVGKTYLIREVMEALEIKDVVRKQPNNVIYAAVSIVDSKTSEKVGVVFIAGATTDIYEYLSDIQSQLLLLTILISLIVGIFVFFISGIIIEPIKVILRVIRNMSYGHLNQRIEIKGHNELYQLASAFNEMAEKLEKVDTSRQEFVSNVSHELKTPLSSIKVLSESLLLQEGIPEQMYREFLQDINSEVDRMAAIINDLLQLVKLDRNQTSIVFKPVNINKCVEDIIKRLKPLAKKKNIDLIYEKNKEVIIDADEMKLSLAISNLIDNAIKYTHQDGVVNIEVDCDHQNSFIKVQDTGIGIGEEEQQKVFERFYRVDKTRDRETGGTGLGLAITHSTILLHNGSIKLISRENEGSTFTVRIPLKQS
jgi:signal transduction histidine kinase